MKKWMDAWGYYVLAALCAGIILFSAVWTRNTQRQAPPDAQALSDGSQRLADVTPAPTAAALHRPADGKIVRPFSAKPVFFPDSGLWQLHPGTDYAADPGENVYALLDGQVTDARGSALSIEHADGLRSEYLGLADIAVRAGERVRAGAVIGHAGAGVPFEGDGFVCVRLTRDGKPIETD